MKNHTYLKSFLMGCISLILWSACSESEYSDTVKPVINLIEPADGDTLLIGAEVHLEMELSDDVLLGAYKIEIHPNFNDHGHTAKAVVEQSVDFTFNRNWPLPAQKNTLIHHHEIVIPENATEGKYHLMVFCTDAAGNESYIARSIVLSHDAPEHSHED